MPLLLFSELSTAHPRLPLAHAPSACFLGTSSCKLSPAVEMRVLGNLMLFPIPVGSKTAFFFVLVTSLSLLSWLSSLWEGAWPRGEVFQDALHEDRQCLWLQL